MELLPIIVPMLLGFLALLFAILRTTGRLDDKIGRLDNKIDQVRVSLEAKMERGFALAREERNHGFALAREERNYGFAMAHQERRDLRNRIDRITDSLALRGLILPESGQQT